MKNKFQLHAPIISVVLSLLAVGYTFAANVVVIPLAADTPSGAVVAFNSNECPTGWQYYEKALSRFIRGMHPASTAGFQSGTTSHNHRWSYWNQNNKSYSTYDSGGTYITMVDWGDGMNTDGSGSYPIGVNNPTGNLSSYTAKQDHTPDYVNLLYCEKV